MIYISEHTLEVAISLDQRLFATVGIQDIQDKYRTSTGQAPHRQL